LIINKMPTLSLRLPKHSEGQKVNALFGEDWRPCEVLSVRKREDSNGHEYYVHFCETDQRLDTWVIDTNIKPLSQEDINALRLKCKRNKAMNSSTEKQDQWEAKFQENVKKRGIEQIYFNEYLIQAWYFSPYPYSFQKEPILKICEFCLKYMAKASTFFDHKAFCRVKHPPGNEIYRDPIRRISVFEVDGEHQKLYSQNLCLLSKLFLQHKTRYFEVESFLFYVICEYGDETGHRLIGYFSKEKRSSENYNLSCIMVLPPAQRRNVGNFLISLSYEISHREEKMGSPEKPLSDLGYKVYQSWWADVLIRYLHEEVVKGVKKLSLQAIMEKTRISRSETQSTLQWLGLTDHLDSLKWKASFIYSKSSLIRMLFTEQEARELARDERIPNRVQFEKKYLEWPVQTRGSERRRG